MEKREDFNTIIGDESTKENESISIKDTYRSNATNQKENFTSKNPNSRKFTFDDSIFQRKKFENSESQSIFNTNNMDATFLNISTSDIKNLKLLLENNSKNNNNNKDEEKKNKKNKNIIFLLTDKPFTKNDLSCMIDLAAYLKSDIITYFNNNNKEDIEFNIKKNIQERILINKIFLHFLLKNKYQLPIENLNKLNLFIFGEFTCSLESLISAFYLQKSRRGDYMKKIKLKGLILLNSIYLKETINFLFPSFDQKFIVPTFFIFGKFSVFSEDFLKDYNEIKKKFANFSEWLPEGGDMSNIHKLYRKSYLEKLKNFLKKFENFKFKNAILLKNKNKKYIKRKNTFKISKNFDEDGNNKITIIDFNKRKSFFEKFEFENLTKKEQEKIDKKTSLKNKVADYFKKLNNKSKVIMDKKFEEKEYINESICKLTIEKNYFELE